MLFSSFVLFSGHSISANTEKIIVPTSEKQSIRYWLPHRVAKSDERVKQAQAVFTQLLHSWDQSRIEPELVIVRSNDGPWAAALADGHILMSYSALQMMDKIRPDAQEDALAFVLAHELSHQRNDDLWHQRFFRTSDIRETLKIDKIKEGRRLKELQADTEGIVAMSVVGFNPLAIIESSNFFTKWVETSSNLKCQHASNSICDFARQREKNIKSKIKAVQRQKIWYELGLVELAEENYVISRKYFINFAKDYPHWLVYNTIASSFLLELILYQSNLSSDNALNAKLYLSLSYLDFLSHSDRPMKRSKAKFKDRSELTNAAIRYLNKSLHLDPNNAETLYLLSLSYLLANNIPMAQGVLKGQLQRIANTGVESSYLEALINIRSQDYNKAFHLLKEALHIANDKQAKNNFIRYAIIDQIRLLPLTEKAKEDATEIVNQFIFSERKKGNSIGFRWGMKEAFSDKPLDYFVKPYAWQDFIGSSEKKVNKNDIGLWLDGEPYFIENKKQQFRLFDKRGKTIKQWCHIINCLDGLKINTRKRLIAKFGLPTSVQRLAGRTYYKYQQAGFIAVLKNQKVDLLFRSEGG